MPICHGLRVGGACHAPFSLPADTDNPLAISSATRVPDGRTHGGTLPRLLKGPSSAWAQLFRAGRDRLPFLPGHRAVAAHQVVAPGRPSNQKMRGMRAAASDAPELS